jgi:hypothetical protein
LATKVNISNVRALVVFFIHINGGIGRCLMKLKRARRRFFYANKPSKPSSNTAIKYLLVLMVAVWSGCGEDGPLSMNQDDFSGNQDELFVKTTFRDDGSLKDEYQYYKAKNLFITLDMPHGSWKHYYKDGRLHWETIYVDGAQNGKWIWYDEEGTITDEDIYENGQCVDMCEGDEAEDQEKYQQA